jgi:pyridoxamine 5'-phosphate oxidase
VEDHPLRESDLDAEPLAQFRKWWDEAEVDGRETVAVATATRDGSPSVRMVLLKGADQRGLVFYTGYESRKGRELDENPQAALLLYWRDLGRQVRVEGRVERTPEVEADEYFASRPLGSKLSAVVSRQSEVIPSRESLEQAAAELHERVGDDVPRPATWGGYRVVPTLWEFWQHREDRMHDRFRYRPEGDGWVIERLSP